MYEFLLLVGNNDPSWLVYAIHEPGDHQTPVAVVAVARRRPCCEVKQGRWAPEARPATVLRVVFEPCMPYVYV